MATVFITGAQGMLGKAISRELIGDGHLLYTLLRKRLDITDYSSTNRLIQAAQPDFVINCAAYTAVDKAEEEPEQCMKVNAEAVRNLADTCAQTGSKLIHFSTDYVFNGEKESPYKTDDKTDPLNMYGRSKELSEEYIQGSGADYMILRTSWLYAPWGKNFMRFLLESQKEEIGVVDNQYGNPTSVLSIADFIAHILVNECWQKGIYHYADRGDMSWYAFAKAIKTTFNLKKTIQSVDSFPSKAVRPTNSRLDCSLTEQMFNYKIPEVLSALERVKAYSPDF